MTAKRRSRRDLAKEARAILKRARCDIITGAKKDGRYRLNKRAQSKRLGRHWRAQRKALGKLGAASPVIDYESGHTIEQRREWDLYILFMVRHVRWPAGYADDHVCWLKRRDYASPSEWMLDDGWRKRIGMTPMSDQLKQAWTDLLAQTANLDRVEINKLIGEEDRALAAEIAAAPPRSRKAQRSLRIREAAS